MIERHDAEHWLGEFKQASPMQKRILRSQIFYQTYRLSEWLGGKHRDYQVGSEVFHLDPKRSEEMEQLSKIIERASSIPEEFRGEAKTEVRVVEKDCVDLARLRVASGLNPVLLNMANAYVPGGGVEGGTTLQEESLCRRSNLLVGLESIKEKNLSLYKIPELGLHWTPHVQFFRGSEASGYVLHKPLSISVISASAYNMKAARGYGGPPTDYQEYADKTKAKIRSIFRVAAAHGHDSLVLSAFGCGSYGNDPSMMAEFFQEVIGENEFSAVFSRIDFAILEEKYSQGATINAFSHCFELDYI